jgi:hypothetical protein
LGLSKLAKRKASFAMVVDCIFTPIHPPSVPGSFATD